MGWENRHLYSFDFGDKTITMPDPDSRNKRVLNASKQRLNEHLTHEGQEVRYLYDFGDSWSHRIVLEKILPVQPDQTYPYCLEGERNCPPEDCGGVWGYQEFLTDLRDENQSKALPWVVKEYDPDRFSLSKVNTLLRKKAYQLNQYQEKKKAPPTKPPKLTAAALKKQLQAMTQQELVQLLVDCFKASKQTEQFLTVKFAGAEAAEALFLECRKKVKDEFFPDRGVGKLRLGEARKAIDEFEKITRHRRYALDLKLFYVEMGVEFANVYGEMEYRFYQSLVSMFSAVVDMLNKEEGTELIEEYKDRIEAVVSASAGIGWGFEEAMQDIYAELGWWNEREAGAGSVS
ncbi:plasmid pRiA4b ORF-3 family protein [Brevibacillus sp. SYP-B805]|nr:plasmid pRiA4b ORF-3 family protein [Brevibacillus sp. SYP-B805]